MSYRPLPSNLKIKESPIDGLGVFAIEDIESETLLGFTHLYIQDDIWGNMLLRLNYGGFINHSSEPNCKLEIFYEEHISNSKHYQTFYKLMVIRDIKAGEELTLDYTKELCGLTGYNNEEWLSQ